jgi:membrane protease YdiL (CAAX protease family)
VTARSTSWSAGAGVAPGIAVVGLLAVAGLLPEARLAILGLLVLGLAAGWRVRAVRWSTAAALPVAVNLAWGTLPGGVARPGLLDCAAPLSPPATWRLGEAIAVGLVIVALARVLGAHGRDLGLRRPTRRELLLGGLAFLVLPVGGLIVGPLLARPFFGEVQLAVGDPRAILPALILAGSNGLMEELIYRGTLMAWLTPVLGARAALVGQALVFGAAHSGPDFTGSPIPVLLTVAAAGLVAGVIVMRTRSLALVILVHAAFDVPLYYTAACRIA